MKRIFPVITILISLSLLGLIFFQVLWIKGSLDTEEQKFMDHVYSAMGTAAEDLIKEKGNLMPMIKQKPFIFPSERLQAELYRPTITQLYSLDQIKYIIQKSFEKQNLKKVPFEFAVTTTSFMGNEMQSENYYNLYSDSANNRILGIVLRNPYHVTERPDTSWASLSTSQ